MLAAFTCKKKQPLPALGVPLFHGFDGEVDDLVAGLTVHVVVGAFDDVVVTVRERGDRLVEILFGVGGKGLGATDDDDRNEAARDQGVDVGADGFLVLELHDLACVEARVVEDQAFDLGLAHRAGVGADEPAHAVAVKIDVVNVDLGKELRLVYDGIEVEHLLVDEVAKVFGVLVGLRRGAVLELELDDGIAVISVALGLCRIPAKIGIKTARNNYRLKRPVALRHRELAGDRVAVTVESDTPDAVLALGFRGLVFIFEFGEKRIRFGLFRFRFIERQFGGIHDQL